MPVSTESDVLVHSHIESLRAKHVVLSQKIENAQKDLSSTDFHVNQLKKKKLMIKEKLVDEERRAVG